MDVYITSVTAAALVWCVQGLSMNESILHSYREEETSPLYRNHPFTTFFLQEFQDLWPELDLVIDGGKIVESENADSRRGSTVVNLSEPGKFTIIRKGR